jgi:hypothetical protein
MGFAYSWPMALRAAAIGIESGHVIVGITLLALPIAAVAFARSGRAWREIGKGPFAIEQELPPSPSRGPAPEVDRRMQAVEARQMLEAKSYRRTRAGRAPIDVDAEMERLLDAPSQPQADDALRAEVRQLVVAGNERRMRRGEAPLDVEAETERQLADLIGSG